MRSLFFKLFLSFVLISLVVSFVTIFISYWARIGPYGELKKQVEHYQVKALTHSLTVTGIASSKMLKNGAEQELVTFLSEVEKEGDIRMYLLKNGNTITGRTLPEEAEYLVAASYRSSGLQTEISKAGIIAVLPVTSVDGTSITLVGSMVSIVRPPLIHYDRAGNEWFIGGFLRHPLILPIIVLVFMTAVGCYILARSLTAPIRDLRKATQQITKGDFSARVDLFSKRGDEVADLSRDFNTMAERTQILLQSQKRLLRDISHELRSPLTRQNIALELARKHHRDAEPYLSRIAKESDRLNELIGMLLLLAKLEGDMDSTPKEPVNLKNLISNIACDAEFEGSSTERRVEIKKIDDVTVLGSKEMLGRAFENVIRNALHYTVGGSAVEVSLSEIDNRVDIIVRDHGPGVLGEHLEYIFKPFFRVAESRDRKSGGVGIGLAIARQAILMHGGSIAARNSTDGGLEINISLPLL